MKYFLLSIALVLFFIGCIQKTPTITPNRASILRTGRWRVTSGTITQRKPNGLDTTLNYLLYIPTCHADDYIRFDSLNHGYSYPGKILCSSADADSISFNWHLHTEEGDNNIDILNAYNIFYMDSETINPNYFFDTLSQSPIVVLDTIAVIPNVIFDTISKSPLVIDTLPLVILDSTWVTNFIPIPLDQSALFDNGVNIYNAYLSNFSQTSFTLNFKWYAWYADTTNHHTGGINFPPISKRDTFLFSITYTNF